MSYQFNDFPKLGGTSSVIGGISGDAMIETGRGRIAIRNLRIGDRVATRDAGFQPLLSLRPLAATAPVAVLEVAAGVLGAQVPVRLSADQPVLMQGWLCNALFSHAEVLALIGAFTNGVHVAPKSERPTALFRLQFSEPQLISTDGLWLSCHSRSGSFARPFLTPKEQDVSAESGVFTRRPGELHARTEAR